MKKLEDDQIVIIAERALRQAHGDVWRAYGYAKQEVNAMLENAPQGIRDSAARRLANALRI